MTVFPTKLLNIKPIRKRGEHSVNISVRKTKNRLKIYRYDRNDKITPQSKPINIDAICLLNPVECNSNRSFIVNSSTVNWL